MINTLYIVFNITVSTMYTSMPNMDVSQDTTNVYKLNPQLLEIQQNS